MKKDVSASNVLFKTLAKNSEMSMPSEGLKGHIYMSLGIIALTCIMIPCCLAMGLVSYMLSTSMMSAEGLTLPGGFVIEGAQMNGLATELHILSIFSLVFSLLVIFNVLFFSADLQHLIPLPFKPVEILRGRFFHTYMAESVMEFMILLSVFIGYMVAAHQNLGVASWLGPVQIISVVIGTVLTPMLPLIYCVLLSFFLMLVLKGVHSRKIFYHSSTVLLLLFVALFFLSFSGMEGINMQNYMDSVAGDRNLFLTVCNRIFFTTPFLMGAIETGSISDLLLYLGLTSLSLYAMLAIGGKLYPACLYNAAALGEKKKAADVDGLRFKVTDPFISYLKKELKILTRTRAYASNCVYINLLWPFGVFILFYLNRNSDGMNDFIEMYIDGTYPRAELIVLLAVIAVSFIACAMNSLASTAFTREGLHADVIKYLPMNFSAQLRAKAFVSILLTWPAVIAAILVAAYYLKIPAPTMVFYIVLSLAALLLSVMTGLLMDSSAPYTEWSDEYSALRGNLNSFFNMAVAMLIALFLCAIAFLSYEFVHIGIVADHFIVLGVIIAADIPMLTLGRKRVLKNMQEMY